MRGAGVAFVFGGQGEDPVPAARAMAPAIRRGLAELCGLDLDRALRTGAPTLADTAVRQPLAVSVQLSIAARLPRADRVAGHSLGALTAHAYVSGWSPLQAARVARVRGLAMAAVAEATPGDLVAFRDLLVAEAFLDQRPGEVALAARNATDEWVLAVRSPALGEALRRGGRRLRVGGPWHGPWMAPAVAELRAALAGMPGEEGRVVNETAGDLVDGLTRPVEWVDVLGRLGATVARVTVVGPGRVQRALLRRALPSMAVALVDRPGDEPVGASAP